MDPNRKPKSREEIEDEGDGPGSPGIRQQDWEAIETGAIAPESIPENGDLRYDGEPSGELPGEDDDNPYQESDDALPEDEDEASISRNPSKEGGRFDEV